MNAIGLGQEIWRVLDKARIKNLTFVRVSGSNSARNSPCFAKRFLCPRLDTLMIIVGHGANSLTQLSTKYIQHTKPYMTHAFLVSPSKHFQVVMYVRSTIKYI